MTPTPPKRTKQQIAAVVPLENGRLDHICGFFNESDIIAFSVHLLDVIRFGKVSYRMRMVVIMSMAFTVSASSSTTVHS